MHTRNLRSNNNNNFILRGCVTVQVNFVLVFSPELIKDHRPEVAFQRAYMPISQHPTVTAINGSSSVVVDRIKAQHTTVGSSRVRSKPASAAALYLRKRPAAAVSIDYVTTILRLGIRIPRHPLTRPIEQLRDLDRTWRTIPSFQCSAPAKPAVHTENGCSLGNPLASDPDPTAAGAMNDALPS